MKLILVLVSIIAVFTVNGHDFSNEPAPIHTDNEDQLSPDGTADHGKALSTVDDENETQDSVKQEDQPKEKSGQHDRKLKRSRCKARNACVVMGGFCVTNATLCSGRLVPEGCKRLNCQCCVPGLIQGKLDNLEEELQLFKENINSTLFSMLNSMNSNINSNLVSKLNNMNSTINSNLDSKLNGISSNISSLDSHINSMNSNINSNIASKFNSMNSNINSLGSNLSNINTSLSLQIQNIGNVCSSIFTHVNGQCLKFINQRVSWADAKAGCTHLHSRLVVPTDLDKLKAHFTKNSLSLSQYWVGASDQSSPGTYKWLNGTVVNSGHWWASFPSGGKRGQSCVKLQQGNKLIAAYDTDCDNSSDKYYYICEE